MIIVWLLLIITILLFSIVLLFGAPYLPTLAPQIQTAIELANLKPNQKVLELGCGDGRVVKAFAKEKIYVTGIELNPILVIIAWLKTYRYRPYAKIVWGNFWTVDWPETDVIFIFLLNKYMKKMDNKCIRYKYKPFKLISFAFKIPDKKITKQSNGLYLYSYK